MEDFELSIALWMVGCWENPINSKLLQNLVHKVIFEFRSIIQQDVAWTHVYW